MDPCLQGCNPRSAAIAVRDAARELACEQASLSRIETFRRLARRINSSLADPGADDASFAALGPTRRGETLVEMLMHFTGPDPVRSAKILLRALEWDGN